MFFGRAAMTEYERQLGIQLAGPIPCIATSNTEDEARAVIWKHVGWSATVTLLFVGICLWAGFSRPPAPDTWTWLGGTIAAVIPLVALVTWFKIRKLRGYRDPRLRVEIGPDEVVVIGPVGRDARPYAALALLELLSGSNKSSRYFIGIVLDSKLGPIRLEDDWYQSGKKAAGAILKRMDALGVPVVLP